MNTKITILEKPSEPISIGNWFLLKGELCQLVQVAPLRVCLIGTESGNRFREPVEVREPRSISKNEFEEIGGYKTIPVKVEILVSLKGQE